mmetsp:Transcript_100257/g.283933  ORF Transcript_100257/g.283933 Transcript_100257/m.283933 type:complete len:359 (+) Transcript_100257:51-1127(+)
MGRRPPSVQVRERRARERPLRREPRRVLALPLLEASVQAHTLPEAQSRAHRAAVVAVVELVVDDGVPAVRDFRPPLLRHDLVELKSIPALMRHLPRELHGKAEAHVLVGQRRGPPALVVPVDEVPGEVVEVQYEHVRLRHKPARGHHLAHVEDGEAAEVQEPVLQLPLRVAPVPGVVRREVAVAHRQQIRLHGMENVYLCRIVRDLHGLPPPLLEESSRCDALEQPRGVQHELHEQRAHAGGLGDRAVIHLLHSLRGGALQPALPAELREALPPDAVHEGDRVLAPQGVGDLLPAEAPAGELRHEAALRLRASRVLLVRVQWQLVVLELGDRRLDLIRLHLHVLPPFGPGQLLVLEHL